MMTPPSSPSGRPRPLGAAAAKQEGARSRSQVGQPILIERPTTHTLRPLSPKLPSGQAPSIDQEVKTVETVTNRPIASGHTSPINLQPDTDAVPPSFAWADQDIPPLSAAPDDLDWQPKPASDTDGVFLSQPPTLKAVSQTTVSTPIARPGVNDAVKVLRLERLTLRINDNIVLRDLSFDMSEGELLGIGGIGAPTSQRLFEAIMSRHQRSAGTIVFPAHSDAPKQSRPSIGWLRLHHAALIQDPWPLLGPDATSIDILSHAARLHGCADPVHTAQRFERLVGLTGAKPSSLGWRLPYRVRLTTALVLMSNPEILLIDHPTRDLGTESAQWLWNTLEQFQDETRASILIASNDLTELERLCDRALLVRHDRLRMQGAPIDLKVQLGDAELKQTFLDPADFDR